MVKIYSYSKLNTFEKCPKKYKFRYIDKIKIEIQSIESLLGSCVHKALEYIYESIKIGKIPQLEEIITIYSNSWEENYNQEIVIVKQELTQKDYFNKGIKFIVDYYAKNHPFKDNTIETEKKVEIYLKGIEDKKLIGYIDRLVYHPKTDKYEIHDYKTANNLPLKKEIDNDRQLAIYSIAIKEEFGYDKDVYLIWHYLAHNKRIYSKRTNEQLNKLKKEILELINKIELTKEFPANKSILCEWCEYKTLCPDFSNFLKNKTNTNQKKFYVQKLLD